MYIKTAKVLEAPNDHTSTHRGRWGKKDLLGSEAEDKRGKDSSLKGLYQSHRSYIKSFYISVNLH